MMDFVGELRLAIRSLVRRPAYAAAAVITLGLGIGANVAIFTVVNAVLLRPLPYPGSDDIVRIRHHAPGLSLPDLESSVGMITLYRESATTIGRLASINTGQVNLTGAGEATRVQVVSTDPEFFEVVATRPSLGRAFVEEDVQAGSAPVAILTDATWRTRFGADPSVIGKRIDVDGRSTEIVGVMPRGFTYPDPKTAMLVARYLDPATGWGSFGIGGMARIAPGQTLETVTREITALQSRITERFPDVEPELLENARWSVTVTRERDRIVSGIATALWVLWATVGLVLLIAGANVANLFLVRAESRQRELAVRAALGASRSRIAETYMAESLVLGIAGGVFGLLLATIGVRLLVATGPSQLPRLHEVGLDLTALAFGAALGVTIGLLLGLMPMIRRGGRAITLVLRDGGRGATAGRERHRVRQILIAGQVAMALMLLVGSGLMLRSVARLRALDTGMQTDNVMTVGVSLGERPRDAARVTYDRILEEVAAIPGVVMVGATNALPLGAGGYNGGSFTVESQTRADDALPPVAMYTVVTNGFFETLGIPILEGRAPEARDHRNGPAVMWVNQTFARLLGGNAIGQRIRFGSDTVWAEVAGVVGDVRTFDLTEEIRPIAYLTMSTTAATQLALMQFTIRSSADAGELVRAIRQAVTRIDGTVPLTDARPMQSIVDASLADTSFTMTLLAIAAGVSLVLGMVGLYGVISYIVAQRTHETGVRMALGARPEDVRAMIVRQGLGVTMAGVVAGLAASLAVTRLIASLLFEVSARDPLTFATVPLLLIAVAALASWLPARRASSVDPMVALRSE